MMGAILDALFALVIAAGALSVALPMLLNLTVQPAQNDAGAQVARMQVAAANYIRVMANVPGKIAAGTSVVTPVALQPAFLSAGFTDSNVFGQKHILVINNTGGTIDGMVYTYGGAAMNDPTAIRVAQSGPADAVVILANPTCAVAQKVIINGQSVCFEGAAGGIALSPASYNPGAAYVIAPGHIGAYIEPMANTPATPFLSRSATGNITDNTMNTTLNMGANAITNASSLTAASVTAGSLTTTGSLAIGSAVAPVTGDLYSSGTINTTGNMFASVYYHQSDRRLKRDIAPINRPLDVVKALQGHRFTWKADGRPDLGFVAQEVQAVLPEAVGTMQTGMMAVKYDVLIAPLVEAVKEQQREITALKAQISRPHQGSHHD